MEREAIDDGIIFVSVVLDMDSVVGSVVTVVVSHFEFVCITGHVSFLDSRKPQAIFSSVALSSQIF